MAFDAVDEVFDIFPWLRTLGKEVYNIIVDGVTNADPSAVIVQNVRESNAYRKRFKGLEMRREQGLPAISEAEYLETEQGYLNQLRQFGVLGTLGLTSTDEFRKWASERIGSDVSVGEINARLDRAEALANDVPDETRQAFQEFYGMEPTHNALVTYFLDEERGIAEVENQLAAAQVGGEAFRYGLNISRTRAEILRREGVTADLARQGFADIAREEPALRRLAQIHNYQPLSQTELEEFFFHEDAETAEKRSRIFRQSLAEFQGGGRAQRSRSGGLMELLDINRTV